jgi:hypothetical protein
MADYKTLSENMMHADIWTMDDTYAMLSSEEIKRRIEGLFPRGFDRDLTSVERERIPSKYYPKC